MFYGKNTSMWRLNNILLKDNWDKKKQKGDQKIHRQMRMTIWYNKLFGCNKGNNKREVYIISGLSEEIRKLPSKQPNGTC